MHSAVSCLSPFTVFQDDQPPITFDNWFNHRLRFNNVRSRSSEVMKDNRNSLLKKEEVLKVLNQVYIAVFQPLHAFSKCYVQRQKNSAKNESQCRKPKCWYRAVRMLVSILFVTSVILLIHHLRYLLANSVTDFNVSTCPKSSFL